MRSDIKRAVVVAVLAFGIVAAVGCRAGESTEGGPRIGGPSSSPVAVTPQPPTVGGGTAPDGLLEPSPEPATVQATSALTASPEATAGVAQSGEQAAFNRPVAGSIPAASTTTPVASAPAVETPRAESNESQVRAAVERYFPPAEWTKAMRVAWCESRYQPWAVEPGGAHVGVYQLDPSLHGSVPADIDGQVRQAADLWRRAGWGPWQCQ